MESLAEGESGSIFNGPVVQLARIAVSKTARWGFESLQGRHAWRSARAV